jgi:hypothetical protein
MKRLILAVLCAAVCASPALAQSSDATGRWEAKFNTPEGPRPATLVLKREGEKLAGTIVGDPGEFAVSGTQKGNDLKLSFTLPRDDGPMVIRMEGTVTGDTIKGPAFYGDDSTGNWTATRAKASDAGGSGSASAGPSSGAAVDVTGAWALEVATDAGTGAPTVTFKQDGEKLTGHYVGQFGESAVEGTIKGNTLTWNVNATVEGNSVHIVYSGTVEKDGIKGKVDFGGMMQGTFTGKRK